MQFIGTDDLKVGMRLARPIYNKQGVLLFERDSKLTAQTIESVKNFGLLGVYILEPAEPLPPMSEEDLEFERFQIATGFSIQDELEKILSTKSQSRINNLASMILKKYGYLDGRVTFYQNLRGRDDFVCRHCLNTAIFCAMITHVMNVRVDEQYQIIYAALTHDIGKLLVPTDVLFGQEDPEGKQRERIYQSQMTGLDVLDLALREGAAVKRICTQALRTWREFEAEGQVNPNNKVTLGAKILMVANRYDELTAMNLQGTSESEVKAIQEFLDHPEIYDPEVVSALIESVNILFPGVSVELSTGQKALVVTENADNILKPIVLTFGDNTLLDLALWDNRDIQIVDIMKTLDNRYIMNNDVLQQNMPEDQVENGNM